MQENIKRNPQLVTKLRATFLKVKIKILFGENRKIKILAFICT